MTDDELRSALREHALLEGDFVLRSGRRSSHYFDKYRFETRPELLEAIGEQSPRSSASTNRPPCRLAGPELGAVALAAASSLASRLPFLIVRKQAKDYGTSNRIEGAFETATGVPRRGRSDLRRSRGRCRRGASRGRPRVPTAVSWSTGRRAEPTSSRVSGCA